MVNGSHLDLIVELPASKRAKGDRLCGHLVRRWESLCSRPVLLPSALFGRLTDSRLLRRCVMGRVGYAIGDAGAC